MARQVYLQEHSAIQQGGNACKNYIHPLMTIFVLSQSQQMIDNL